MQVRKGGVGVRTVGTAALKGMAFKGSPHLWVKSGGCRRGSALKALQVVRRQKKTARLMMHFGDYITGGKTYLNGDL